MAESIKALTPNWDYVPFDAPYLITINLRLRTPRLVVMKEMVAIYTIMFYFGSLVRYRPEVLEGMLLKKDAWMIESFLRSTPITFLRHARNLLDGNYLAFQQR